MWTPLLHLLTSKAPPKEGKSRARDRQGTRASLESPENPNRTLACPLWPHGGPNPFARRREARLTSPAQETLAPIRVPAEMERWFTTTEEPGRPIRTLPKGTLLLRQWVHRLSPTAVGMGNFKDEGRRGLAQNHHSAAVSPLPLSTHPLMSPRHFPKIRPLASHQHKKTLLHQFPRSSPLNSRPLAPISQQSTSRQRPTSSPPRKNEKTANRQTPTV